MHTKDLTHHAILSKSTVNSPRDRGLRPHLARGAAQGCRPKYLPPTRPRAPKVALPLCKPRLSSAVLYAISRDAGVSAAVPDVIPQPRSLAPSAGLGLGTLAPTLFG